MSQYFRNTTTACMLEGLLEVFIIKKEVERTTSVYQNSHITPLTLPGYKLDEHTCMGLSMKLQMAMMAHFALLLTIMFHVQCATL